MKKMTVAVLVLLVCIMISACEANDTGRAQNDESMATAEMETGTVTMGTTEAVEESGPSWALIKKDLVEGIKEVNGYATITNLEIIKSLTNEGSYKATINVFAETTYADWEYETEVKYTKYDQGWIVDEMYWSDSQYALARVPNADTIIDIANQLGEKIPFYYDILPIEAGSLNTNETLVTEQLVLEFEKPRKLKHADENTQYFMRWSYDSGIDGWVFAEEDDGFSYTRSIKPYDVDLSGKWSGVTVSDFSWDGFDLSMDSYFDGRINTHFFKIKGHPRTNEEEFGWYGDGNGYYCRISCGPDKTSLAVYSWGGSLVQHAYVSIG